MKISIVIPAYNEEKRISKTLKEYGTYFKEKKKNKEIDKFEILIVLNACKDRTIDVVKDYEKKFGEIKHLEFKRGGKGFAIVEGFRDALKEDYDLIGFVDADMATSPEAFFDLMKNIGSYDGIIASRYIKGAKVFPKRSISRILASRIFNLLIKSFLFLNYYDTQCGAKIFRKRAVESIIDRIGMTKWAFDVELLYKLKKQGMRIKEFPTVWVDKEYSKINLKSAGPAMALAIIRLRILNSRFKRFVKIYDQLPKFLKLT